MSYMKQYAEDVQEFTMRAAGIAWHPNTQERKALYTELYYDCFKASETYADPVAVTLLLMREVAKSYAKAFMAQHSA